MTLPLPKFQIEVDKHYSITITPNDNYQFEGKPDRYKSFRQMLRGVLSSIGCLYSVYIEASEPMSTTKTPRSIGPRLHAHGIIYIRDREQMRELLLYGLYSLTRIGSYDLDTVDDLYHWKAYCTKQNWVWQRDPLENCDIWDPCIIKSVQQSVSDVEAPFFVDQTS